MSGLPRPTEEHGSTLVELLVGMAIGMIVLTGLSMLIITTMHGNSRVDARVEATQNARLTVTKIIEQLHSACVAPMTIPLKENSSGTKLIFVHAASGEASAVAPTQELSEIVYEPGTPGVLWETEGGVKRKLLSKAAPGGPNGTIFNYFKVENGKLATSKLATPLTKTTASEAVYVTVALSAEPISNPTRDAGANATVFDSATLRLTPPVYYTGSAPPCQ